MTAPLQPNPAGDTLRLVTAFFYGFSVSNFDMYVLTPLMHIVTIALGIASFYFLFKPKNKDEQP